jgi:hypothetical protein
MGPHGSLDPVNNTYSSESSRLESGPHGSLDPENNTYSSESSRLERGKDNNEKQYCGYVSFHLVHHQK